MDELTAMQEIAERLDKVRDKDSQKRILTWAFSKYLGDEGLANVAGGGTAKASPRKKKGNTSARSGKKQTYIQIKSLDLTPEGKQSLVEFAAAKNPSSFLQKITLAVYYLRNEAGVDAVSIDHVYTCFKWMKWKLPNDLKNTIHQTGSKGNLDTSDADDLLVTPLGENVIEHELG